MRLRYTPMKGYVHTIEAVVNYCGLRDVIEPVATDPFDDIESLLADNPLSTVPTLLLETGEAIYGGPVIYEYLDTLHDSERLFPADHWLPVRRLLWMSDGLFDQWIRATREVKEEPAMRRHEFIARQWSKVLRCMDHLEALAPGFKRLDIGQVRTVGSLSFIDKTFDLVIGLMETDALPDKFDWREGRPHLTKWYETLSTDRMFHLPLGKERASRDGADKD
jgi:glutathione S-transferase